MSVFLDILRRVYCCDDPHYDELGWLHLQPRWKPSISWFKNVESRINLKLMQKNDMFVFLDLLRRFYCCNDPHYDEVGWLHLQPRWNPSISWFKNAEFRVNHHLSGLFRVSSLAWKGHLVHVAILGSKEEYVGWNNFFDVLLHPQGLGPLFTGQWNLYTQNSDSNNHLFGASQGAGYREISTADSSASYRFSNVCDTSTYVPESSYQRYQSDTSIGNLRYYDHYPNYYSSSSSAEGSERLLRPSSPKTLEKSSQASHNVKTSSPLSPPQRLHSSPVFSQPSPEPVAPFPGQSTSSSNASSSSRSNSNSLPSTPRLPTTSTPSPFSSAGLTQSSTNQPISSPKLQTAIPKPSKTCSLPSPSTPKGIRYPPGLPASSPELPPTSNPTLHPMPSNSTNSQDYLLDSKSSLPLFLIPKDVEDLIKKDIVPEVLKKPLSPSTYRPYFAALLYAEDFYHKKWSEYKLEKITLKLKEITIHSRTNEKAKFSDLEKVNKTFVSFEIDSVPERRPFLLSRDLVHARLSGRKVEPFQGFVYRVTKSDCALGKRNVLLVDFGEDFYSRHHENNKYDISFTFNRVCLKRAQQAVEDASDSLFQNFLFPESRSRLRSPRTPVMHSSYHQLDPNQKDAVCQISFLVNSPPYLIRGPPCIRKGWGENQKLSRTGVIVQQAVFQIYSTSPNSRILICASTNIACDELMISLKQLIPESNMFRAIAAFRELVEVPLDILSLCDYDDNNECFTCPPLKKLRKYKIIFSTFMSSFRLHDEGLSAGHFSHIFLLDASAATEPETLVPLTKFATDVTAVIVTGHRGHQPYWVRSDIARRHGLKTSYFERLEERWPYRNLHPLFITEVSEEDTVGGDSSVSG